MSAPTRPRWVVNVASIGMIVVTLALLLGLAALSGFRGLPTPALPAFVDLEVVSDPTPVPLDPGELTERYGAAVWRVEAAGCGIESIGTAFAIDDLLLVTTRQVTEIDAAPRLVSRDGSRRLDAVVVGFSQDPDLAVLEVRQFLMPTLAWADPAGLTEGEQLVVLGHAAPEHVTLTTIRSFVTEGAVRRAIHAEGLSAADSHGAPALTSEGRVAGMVTVAVGPDGRHLVPVLTTHEHLQGAIETLVEGRPGAEVRCDALGVRAEIPGLGAEPG